MWQFSMCVTQRDLTRAANPKWQLGMWILKSEMAVRYVFCRSPQQASNYHSAGALQIWSSHLVRELPRQLQQTLSFRSPPALTPLSCQGLASVVWKTGCQVSGLQANPNENQSLWIFKMVRRSYRPNSTTLYTELQAQKRYGDIIYFLAEFRQNVFL